ncbi:MAG: Gfo/Idh/MocA family oxidoreductase [Planctomycetaceae bacterium]|nr:Gfo/Idh/MocA family oxidoreductase [Planctomycetaceae bacterium]
MSRQKLSRREMLERSMFATAAAVAAEYASLPVLFGQDAPGSKSPNERIRIAVTGANGRGGSHIGEIRKRQDAEVAAIVDVDEAVGQRWIGAIEKETGKKPAFYKDLRQALEDKTIDAVSIATPNHWHSLAAIWSMQAGKDVYVEKPVSHNVSEGRRCVQVARKHKRICQTGTQSRSNSGMRQAIEFIHEGGIGEVKLARGLCYKRRGSIGPRGVYEPPKSVDYDLWSGPAPIKPITRGKFHYDWHWQWDYGNGDLGNQGIHQMDIARWGLGVSDLGDGVLSYGGRVGYFDKEGNVEADAGETANTQVCIHRYGDKRLVFEVRGLPTPKLTPPKGDAAADVGVIFYGSKGYVVMPSYSAGIVFDLDGNKVKEFKGGGDSAHWENFLAACRSRKHEDLHADILEGHLSSALCHLGNISYRLGEQMPVAEIKQRLVGDSEALETFSRFSEHLVANKVDVASTKGSFGLDLTLDGKKEIFIGSHADAANPMLTREYRKPFVVPAEKDV